MPDLPAAARRLAREQFGAITRQQLAEHLAVRQIDGLVNRGRLERLRWGVYRVAGGAAPPEQAAMAAVLRTKGSRVSGPFVAGLFGAEGFSRDDPFVLLTPDGRRPRSAAFAVRADPAPGRHDATWDSGLPIVTPTLCCLDLAHPRQELDDTVLRTAVDSLRWSGHTSTARLDAATDELAGHLGADRIRGMLADGSLVAESQKERDLATVLDGISPPPRRQVRILAYRLDFMWPSVRLDVEYDGKVHERPDRRESDRLRDDALTAAGYEVLRLTAADLDDREALRANVLDTLRRLAAAHDLDPLTFH